MRPDRLCIMKMSPYTVPYVWDWCSVHHIQTSGSVYEFIVFPYKHRPKRFGNAASNLPSYSTFFRLILSTPLEIMSWYESGVWMYLSFSDSTKKIISTAKFVGRCMTCSAKLTCLINNNSNVHRHLKVSNQSKIIN